MKSGIGKSLSPINKQREWLALLSPSKALRRDTPAWRSDDLYTKVVLLLNLETLSISLLVQQCPFQFWMTFQVGPADSRMLSVCGGGGGEA